MNNISVPRQIGVIDPELMDQIFKEVQSDSKLGQQWVEKIRRFISYYNHNLKKVSRKRFGKSYFDHLKWFYLIMKFATEKELESNNMPMNNTYLNALVVISSALRLDQSSEEALEEILKLIELKLKKNKSLEIFKNDLGKELPDELDHLHKESKTHNGIIILCPSPYSLFSLSIAGACKKLGIKIHKIYILSFSMNRFLFELRRDGLKLFAKRVWRKLFVRGDENKVTTHISLKKLSQVVTSYKDIRKFAKANGIKCKTVNSFSDIESIDKSLKNVLTIFTGGGLIHEQTLKRLQNHVINTHMGLLPYYKGMDVVESPLLDGNNNSIALHTHLMVKKLDAGPLLTFLRFDPDEYNSLDELRNEIGGMMPIICIDSLLGLHSGRLHPIEQNQDQGKQCFFVASKLITLLDRVLKERYTEIKDNSLREKNTRIYNNFLELFS